MASGKSTVYWDYIKIEELLALQGGIADTDAELANDEVMFIIIHQIDELWFKLAIRELVHVRDLFAREKVREQSLSSAVRGIRRTALLFEQVARHFALMETMTTRDYLGFRDKLSPASGFQSAQLREIEILLGLKIEERLPLGHDNDYLRALRYPDGRESPASRRVEARLTDRPSLHEAIGEWLYPHADPGLDAGAGGRRGAGGPLPRELPGGAGARAEGRARAGDRGGPGRGGPHAAGAALQAGAGQRAGLPDGRRRAAGAAPQVVPDPRGAGVHRELPRAAAAGLAARGARLDRGARAGVRDLPPAARADGRAGGRAPHRHGRLGGRRLPRPDGAAYRVFRDLWAVRTLLIQRSALPPLERPEAYGFVAADAD
jgi:tryptophan 2,3-dioxygenase